MLYNENRKFIEQNKKLFGRWSSFYDSKVNRLLFFEATYRRLISTITSVSGKDLSQQNCRVLDVACGTGEVVRRLAAEHESAAFVGIDLTEEMLERARRKSIGYANVKFMSGNVTRLPFDSASFDIIICSDAFHHFGEPDHALREIQRVLKSHSMFFIVDPAPDTMMGRLIFNRIFKKVEHAHKYYSKVELKKILHSHGLQVVSHFSYYFQNYFVCTKE